jgi:TPR repeat protein
MEAEYGLVAAQRTVDVLCFKGHWVPRNYLEAAKWWLRAMKPRIGI